MFTLATTFFLSGLLTIGICLPMVFGKVPMNAWYGMRTKSAFRSQEAWEHLNEVGGMLYSLLGFPMILGGLVGFFLKDDHVPLVGMVTSIVTLVSCGFASVLFLRYANRYTKRMDDEAS